MVKKRNQDLRLTIKKAKIPYWAIAELLECHVNTFYNLLNKELTTEQKNEILAIVNQLKETNAAGA